MLQLSVEDPPSWLIVVGHYPIYSAGSQGDSSELITNVLPLLKKYHVHAYICGHDHISEHLQLDGIEYFVAGAGSMTDQLKYTSKASLAWSGTGYSAFAAMDATATELKISFMDSDGATKYEYVQTNFNPVFPKRPPNKDPDSAKVGWRAQLVNPNDFTVAVAGASMSLLVLTFCLHRTCYGPSAKYKEEKLAMLVNLDDGDVFSAINPDRDMLRHKDLTRLNSPGNNNDIEVADVINPAKRYSLALPSDDNNYTESNDVMFTQQTSASATPTPTTQDSLMRMIDSVSAHPSPYSRSSFTSRSPSLVASSKAGTPMVVSACASLPPSPISHHSHDATYNSLIANIAGSPRPPNSNPGGKYQFISASDDDLEQQSPSYKNSKTSHG